MSGGQSSMGFMFMKILFGIRDFIRPRRDILKEAGIELGFTVLDYGCGSGSYVVSAATLAGSSGRLYALDVNPLAVKEAEAIAERNGLTNVVTIETNADTGLPDNEVDIVLLYDVFHMLDDPEAVLRELHRVLKPDGILSMSDHHMNEQDIVAGMTASGLFALSNKGEHTFGFSKL